MKKSVAKYVIVILSGSLLLSFFGCESNSKRLDIQGVNLNSSYPEETIILQNIATIKYIPLETADNILLGAGGKIALVSEKHIIAYNGGQGDIYIFTPDGKIENGFNHKGPGTMEYNYIQSLVVDEENQELFVLDSYYFAKCQVYSLNGEYKRTLKLPEAVNLKAYNWDKETLLCYDEAGVLLMKDYRVDPYLFVSKKDGSIISALDITFQERFTSINTQLTVGSDGKNIVNTYILQIPNNRHDGDDFVLGDMFSDTIFSLSQNKAITPLLIKTPSVFTTDPKIVLTPIFKVDKFMILQRSVLDFDMYKTERKFPKSTLMYNFENKLINEITFVNNDCPEIYQILDVDTEKNTVVFCLEAFDLIETEGELGGELKHIASTLHSEDNWVLMIAKFD